MTAWGGFAADYLRLRRQLGARLDWPEHLLGELCAELDASGTDALTVADAIAWCSVLPAGVTIAPQFRASTRMRTVRGFATYMHALNPIHEVPPSGIFPDRAHRSTPYIYTATGIAAVIRAAATQSGDMRIRTFPVIFALLAATGLRIGEAIALDRDTADLNEGVLLISRGKTEIPTWCPFIRVSPPLSNAMPSGATSATWVITVRRSSPIRAANG